MIAFRRFRPLVIALVAPLLGLTACDNADPELRELADQLMACFLDGDKCPEELSGQIEVAAGLSRSFTVRAESAHRLLSRITLFTRGALAHQEVFDLSDLAQGTIDKVFVVSVPAHLKEGETFQLMAMIENDVSDEDLAVQVRGKPLACRVVDFPFLKPRTKGDPWAERNLPS